MDMEQLAKTSGEWLRGSGPQSDIVISSRIRLARNLADFPFIARATESDRDEVGKILRDRVTTLHEAGQFAGQLIYVDVRALEEVDRRFLVERQLISREHAEAEGARSVAIDPGETFSVMINEEDHLRFQVMQSGLNLTAAWQQANDLDDLIEEKVTYAYSDKLGYLTACPTNVGTGVRMSVMLHLPALVITRQIEKVFRSLQKINLAVRGLYGEGSQAMGDFYQISNQVTLGLGEEELMKKVSDVVPVLLDYERQARDFLMRELSGIVLGQVRDALQKRSSTQVGTPNDEPPVVAQLMVEIRSDGSRTIARGALNDLRTGESAQVHAEGKSPGDLMLSLAGSLLALPATFSQAIFRRNTAPELKKADEPVATVTAGTSQAKDKDANVGPR